MDLVTGKIPFSFVSRRVALSWQDVRFGLQEQLLDPGAAIELAVDQLANLDTAPVSLTKLAGMARSDGLAEVVGELAAKEPVVPDNVIQEKWLYILLSWVYEHKNDVEDPLHLVEQIYADFGYPPQVAAFVRYMPMEGPDLGSREGNERRLIDRWKEYLYKTAPFYK